MVFGGRVSYLRASLASIWRLESHDHNSKVGLYPRNRE